MGLLYTLLLGWPLGLISSLLAHFLLILALVIAWRAYKTYLVRRVDFLHARHMKPLGGSSQAILITGATSGIGLAVAKHLYGQGYSIIGTYLTTKEAGYEELKQLAGAKSKKSGQQQQHLLLVELDVRQAKDIAKAYTLIEDWLDRNKLELYALINNAGLGSLQPFAWLQRASIFRLIDTNIMGYLLMTREFIPLLAKCKRGSRILLVSSGLGLVPGATFATYGLAKCAQIYFAKCLNAELKARYNIQTVALIPHNFIKTTNICTTNVKQNEDAWEELKPLERQLYKREFDEHLARVKSLEQATQRIKLEEPNNRRREQVSGGGGGGGGGGRGKQGNGDSQRTGAVSRLHDLREFACKAIEFSHNIIRSLRGENTSLTLEESGALECFEDALRLRDPPDQIFAGDPIWQLIIGSLLLVLPNSCLALLGPSMTQGMYK